MTTIALYPGSFDPMTNGHLDIAKRALGVFDRLIMGIAVNARKQPLFTVDERIELISSVFENEPRVEVHAFEGLTIQYAEQCGAKAIVRGLRAVADFEYELQMANMNKRLDPDIETLFMMTSEGYFFISSQNVKEVSRFGGDITHLVPPIVAQRVAEKMAQSDSP